MYTSLCEQVTFVSFMKYIGIQVTFLGWTLLFLISAS